MKNILIIAGEASSDMHAANLIKEIKNLNRDISFFGLGGERMRDSGVELLEDIVKIAFIGPGGLFKHYFTLRKIFYRLLNRIKTDPPDAAILIDYAEFNLRIAKALKELGVPVIYYISPQVWAWGLWRIHTIKKYVSKMIVFFEFEKRLYERYDMDATFVGHPLIETVKTDCEKSEIIKKLGLSNDSTIIGIVPGSRKSEIDNILPIMLKSSKIIKNRAINKKIDFILPKAPTIERGHINHIISDNPLGVKVVEDNRYNAISICDCAMVTSGTATLEAALLDVPMAVLYKSNFLTYILTKNLIKLPYIGLVNVVAGKKIVPEFLQYDADPQKIADYISQIINDANLSSAMRSDYSKIKKSLGSEGASRRAAKEVLRLISN